MPHQPVSFSYLLSTGFILLFSLFCTFSTPSSVIGAEQNNNPEPHWQAPSAAALRPNPRYPDEESLDRGKLMFRKYCVFCHGRDGEGDGPYRERLEAIPANLTKLPGILSDGDLAWKIAHGRYPMPAWQGIITEEEIWDIVNFIRNLKRTESQ